MEEQDNQELFEHISLTVEKGQFPLRIDKYILNRVEKISRNRIQQSAKESYLLVNGKPVKVNYKIRPFDEIKMVLPKPKSEFKLIPEKMDLDIVYEDDDVMVINKTAGVVVHPGTGNWTGTLCNGLAHHLGDVEKLGLNAHRPGIVHRIDKWTSGLLVVAKNPESLTHLSKQFFDKTTDRLYLALVWGEPVEQEGTITGNIARSIRDRKVFQVFEDEGIGKHAITHYKTLEELCYVSVVECKLETGRTHQIRVHMKHKGHPLFADQEYGGNRIVKGTVFTKYKQFVDNCFKICNRQALHARSLAFTHPKTGERLSFTQDPPEDMELVIDKWRKYAHQLKH